MFAESAKDERCQPAGAAPGDAAHVGTVDMGRMEILPHVDQPAHAAPEIRGVGGDGRGIDRSGGCSANNLKRTWAACRPHLGDRSQHADLVRGARTASGQHQPYLWASGLDTVHRRSRFRHSMDVSSASRARILSEYRLDLQVHDVVVRGYDA